MNDPAVISAYIGQKFAQRYQNEFHGAVAQSVDQAGAANQEGR